MPAAVFCLLAPRRLLAAVLLLSAFAAAADYRYLETQPPAAMAPTSGNMIMR